MAEIVVDRRECAKCGAEIREGSAFCHACGGRVKADEVAAESSNGSLRSNDAETQAALDDLAAKLKGDAPTTEPENKLTKAAEERKKARGTQRRAREFVWEPHDEFPVVLLIAVLVVLVAAVLTVLVTVVWK